MVASSSDYAAANNSTAAARFNIHSCSSSTAKALENFSGTICYVIRWIPAPARAIPLVFLFAVSLLPASAFADTNTLSFSQNHQLWDHGAEIKTLQQFLNAQGFLVARSGPGSPGDETTVFGLLTYNALLKYQAAHDLPATGYFGPTTRGFMSESSAHSSSGGVLNGAQSSSQITSPATFPRSTVPTSLPVVSLSFGGAGEGGGGGSVSTTPSCDITATSPTITLGDSSLLTWSSSNAVSASLSGVGSVGLSSSTDVTPNTTSAYTLTVTNNAGATATCDTTVTVIGFSGHTPPTVSLTVPTNGAAVGGSSVTLTATATDTDAIAYVQFKVGNTNIGSAILSSPYTTTWSTTATTTPDGSYTLSAVAADISGNLATSSITVTVRNTSPVISSIATTPSYATATTTWTTDEAANSEVVYGFTTSYGLASSSASFVTSHSILLSGLTASSTYHYAVVSADANGLTSTSSDQTFTTPATSTPPIISNISGTPTTTAATITWTTDQSSNSKVVWGLTTGYGSASSSASYLTSHSISISALATSTTYHFAVVSANTFGATATSSDQTLTTTSGAPDYTPPTEPTDVVATPQTASEISLSWTASTGNGVDPVAGYQIFRDGNQVATDTSGTTYNDTGLSASTLHSYWVDAYDTGNNVSTTTAGISAETEAGADQYGTTWKPLRIGAGGYITGIDIASDGTRVIRTDTYGAYIWDGTQWDQLISTSSMPTSFINLNIDGTGVYEIAIAPSDSRIFYIEYDGYIFRSNNRGVTWAQTNFSQVTDASNDAYRTYGRKIAVDPANADIVYAGTPGQGLWVTTNAGNSWSEVSGIAATSTVGYAIAFDPTSGVVGGKTQGIYVASYDEGVYHSTDGGATWTLTSGSPSTFRHMVVGPDGVVYVIADDNSNNLYIYSGSSWSSVVAANNNGNPAHAVAVDPNDPNRIVVAHVGGDITVSQNHGATWSGYSDNLSLVSTDIPWLVHSGTFMSSGDLAFDPTQSDVLYQSVGDGVAYTDPTETTSNPSVVWTFQSKGIEQLVANTIVSPPGGQPLVVSWDRGVFYVANPETFPSDYGPDDSFNAGWDVSYAPNDPSYVAGIFGDGNDEQSGYSTDGGQTWQTFASLAPSFSSYGGSLAVASSTDIVVFPSNNSQPYYTLDGGNTWNHILISGLPTSGESGWGWAYYLDRHIVAADPVNIGTFYAYNYGPSGSGAGLYKSTDGGVDWTRAYAGSIDSPYNSFNATLKVSPVTSGELFFTGGPVGGDTLASPASEPFEHSTNGGSSWSAVPNVQDVWTFGFGKAAPGTTTPAIYIVGWVSNQFGIWESDDDANTWTQIGEWPSGSLDPIKTISGDMNAYGRVYVGFSGEGYAYGDTANAQIPPIIASISSGTPTTTSATITWTTDQSANSEVVYGPSQSYGSSSSNASFVTSHSITLTGLASGTMYHFEVVSADSNGYTATSTDQTFITHNSSPPSVPTSLVATATSSSEIDLSWTASTGDGTYSVAGYQVFRNGTQVATTSNSTYADTGLSAATAYSYTVDAYDTAGNISSQSSSAGATTQGGVLFTPTDDPPFQNADFGSNTATFSNVNIGTAASDRIVVVGVANSNGYGGNDSGIASVTIGGTAATEATSSDPGQDVASLWYATIPAGTTANIIVTCKSGALFLTDILVGNITGASTSTPTATGVHSLSVNVSDPQVTPYVGSITVPEDGTAVIFAAGGADNNTTATWTNTSSASGDYYDATSTPDNGGVALSDLLAHSYAAGSETYSVSGNVGNGFAYAGFAGVAAAWAP